MIWDQSVQFEECVVSYYESGDYIVHNYKLNSWIVVNKDHYNGIISPLQYGHQTPAAVIKAYATSHQVTEAQAKQVVGRLLMFIWANGLAQHPNQAPIQYPTDNLKRTVPKIIYFVSTYRCNLSCKYCYAESSPFVDTRQDLSTAEALAMIDQIAELGVKYMAFTGGEALLRKDCIDLIAHAKARGLKVFLITNGAPVTAEKAARLTPLLDGVTVSMDSPDPHTGHDAVRGEGAWEMANRAIAHFQSAGIPVAINTTVTADSVSALPDMVEWVLDRGIETHRIGFVSDLGRGGQARIAATLQERLASEREAHRVLVDRLDEVPLQGLKFYHSPLPPFLLKRHCGVGTEEISIDSFGDVYPCKLLHLDHLKAGNIRNQSLREIWETSPVFDAMLTVNPDHLPDCQPCTFRYVCGGGCRAHQMSMTGDLYGTFNQDCPTLRRSLRRYMWLDWQKRFARMQTGQSDQRPDNAKLTKEAPHIC